MINIYYKILIFNLKKNKFTQFHSPLMRNILENSSLTTLERSLNYIFHLFYVKIYNFIP